MELEDNKEQMNADEISNIMVKANENSFFLLLCSFSTQEGKKKKHTKQSLRKLLKNTAVN